MYNMNSTSVKSYTFPEKSYDANINACGFTPSIFKTQRETKTLSQKLLVHGQGVFIFKVDKNTTSTSFSIRNSKSANSMHNGIQVTLTEDNVVVTDLFTGEKLNDPNNNKGLNDADGAFYWFSLDSQNQCLLCGVGEARLDTIIYKYSYPTDNLQSSTLTKLILESLNNINYYYEITPIRLLRDPIVAKVPLFVKDKNHLTMTDIAEGKILPSANLNSVGNQLYECVSGEKFVLNTPDFPDFSEAIEYSIKTPGCWCNTTLQNKSREFNKDKPNIKETYLRITIGKNDGESPGIPYVMEIWPVGHYSPIHSHSDANAIIRVLHGTIHVELYPFLCGNNEEKVINPFGEVDFVKDDVTWISPYLNQVHKLTNLENSTDTCITIQCYLYGKLDNRHYDYFDYIDNTGKIEHYTPDSDMGFLEFKQKMKDEWEARKN